MLRLIMGWEKPTEGQVRFDGREVGPPDRHRGVVFQKYSLFPHLSVIDNIIFGLTMERFTLPGRIFRPWRWVRRRRMHRSEADGYLQRMGLEGQGDKYPHQLSGGMRQRVAIAQALIMKPRILLMDEPFGALDDSIRQEMQLFLLEQWEAAGMTVFFVTHDLEEACFLGARVLVLSQFYTSDAESVEGAKIVVDLAPAGGHPKPTTFKHSPELREMVDKIRREGLDPEHLQHMRDFDLSHRDAFRTADPSEWRSEPGAGA
jgi:NitT/TauT family transport system ATP-binding protein